jgi:hypothetical protein
VARERGATPVHILCGTKPESLHERISAIPEIRSREARKNAWREWDSHAALFRTWLPLGSHLAPVPEVALKRCVTLGYVERSHYAALLDTAMRSCSESSRKYPAPSVHIDERGILLAQVEGTRRSSRAQMATAAGEAHLHKLHRCDALLAEASFTLLLRTIRFHNEATQRYPSPPGLLAPLLFCERRPDCSQCTGAWVRERSCKASPGRCGSGGAGCAPPTQVYSPIKSLWLSPVLH